MRGVDRRRAAGHEADMPGPRQRPAAFGADAAIPAAIVDFPQRRQHFGAGVAVHVDDRREVLQEQDAAALGSFRSTPPVASLARSFLPVPERSAAGPVMDDSSTTSGITANGINRSVLPTPEPPTSISQTGSPSSLRFAT